jgi:hypothetical protein
MPAPITASNPCPSLLQFVPFLVPLTTSKFNNISNNLKGRLWRSVFRSTMTPALATVGILSIGEMGLGVANLLIAHNYRVVTNLEGRRYLEVLLCHCVSPGTEAIQL